MNIEDALRGNTEAIVALTEALIKLQIAVSGISTPKKDEESPKTTAIKCECGKCDTCIAEYPTDPEEEVLEVSAPVDYKTVKDFINQLALTHRDRIKELNTKHGLSKFADVLNNPKDPDSGIKNQELVNNYYDALIDMERGN